jgi:hypothetical protein
MNTHETLFSEYFASLESKGNGEGYTDGAGTFLWSGMKYSDQEDEREKAEQEIDNRSPLAAFEKATKLTLEVLDKVRDQLNFLEQSKRCIHCSQNYYRKQNLGYLKCRWHPDPGIDLLRYSCCGEKRDIFQHSGCKRCDHSSQQDSEGRWHDRNKIEPMPLIVALELKIPSQHYTIVDEGDVRKTKALVKRCEF